MAFTIAQASSDGVLLNRKMVVFPAQMFILVGIVFILVSVIPILFYESLDAEFRAIMPLLSIIGFVSIITGIRYPIEQKRSIPDSLHFDNAHGRVRIYHSYSETPEAFIYYPEIKGFYLEQIAETKKTNRYIVLLKKVDGGEWDLFHSRSYSSASKFLEVIRAKVRLSVEPQRVESAALPVSKVRVEQKDKQLEICWKNNIRENVTSMVIWMIAITVAVMYSFNFIFNSENKSSFVLEALLFIVFLMVAGLNFYNLHKLSSVIHSIEVDENSIHVVEKDKQGRVFKEEKFAFPQIFSIYYKFNSANPEAKLFFVKQTDEDERARILATPENKTAARTDFFKDQFAVNFKDLTTLEVLSIESYIQDFVRNRTRIEIL